MRKEIMLTLEDRGKTLTFKIREMPATQLESWIFRTLLVLTGNGMDLPAQGDIGSVARYLLEHGLRGLGGVDYEQARPLLDELLGCCFRVISGARGGAEQQVTPATADGYIEDVTTLLTLRLEALKLNLGFFAAAVPSFSPQAPERTTA